MGKFVTILFALLATASLCSAATHYVDVSSASPAPPFTSWATTAVTIQDAVDVASDGDAVVVTNGAFRTGTRVAGGATNRLVIDKAVVVRAVRPLQCFIEGDIYFHLRCVYLGAGACLSGFHIREGVAPPELNGGGVYCASSNSVISNCFLILNEAEVGGAVYGDTVNNSTLETNYAVFVGAAANAALNNCFLQGNTAATNGGGTWECVLNNCSVLSNWGGAAGAGVAFSTLRNSIVWDNGTNWFSSSFTNCCTIPDPGGEGNITNSPGFVLVPFDPQPHLQSNSPCINAGNNAYVATPVDLDGNPRIRNGTVDIGAYEFQGSTGLTGFHAWLAQYGLPSDGSADYLDSDGDGMNNWQEWIAGTNPTNAASALRMVSAARAANDVRVTWQSVLGIGYFVQRSTNLSLAQTWTAVGTDLPGQTGTTTFIDANAATVSPLFYRVGVGN